MANSKPHVGRKYIFPLNMNKLRGRMLNMPKNTQSSKADILIVYGQKSSLEKWSPLANELRKYGNVTMPDLPGIGGMQNFYRINEKPSLDNYADYLASFIKLRYRRKKIVIVGMSFGFVVVTKMLQKYPDLNKKVNLLINLSGFVHKDDIKLSVLHKYELRLLSKLLAHKSLASIYGSVAHDEFVYKLRHRKKYGKTHGIPKSEMKRNIKYDLNILRKCDTRTHMYILGALTKLDNSHQTIDLPIWSLVGSFDEFLYPDSVKNHLEMVFSKYHEIKLKKKSHSGIIGVLTPENIAQSVPFRLKALLNRQNK